jgi:hypothetical protein
MVGQILASFDTGQLLKEDWISDGHPDRFTDFVLHFVDDEGKAEGQTELADELKNVTVLAVKVDGHDRSLGHLDELGGEQLSIKVSNLA